MWAERESSLADPHGGPAATECTRITDKEVVTPPSGTKGPCIIYSQIFFFFLLFVCPTWKWAVAWDLREIGSAWEEGVRAGLAA